MTGYIASHVYLELQASGIYAVGLDNFANSSPLVLDRLAELSGEAVPFVEGDIADRDLLFRVFDEHRIDTVMHFAAHKAVGESVDKPLEYYENNVGGSIAMFSAMRAAGVGQFVFSSSAAIYEPQNEAVTEESNVLPLSPYGRTKAIIEDVACDIAAADPEFKAILLRYFNPVGAHPSGRIGEDPKGIPNNLMPYIMQVAVGRRNELQVFGDDYDTPDGTGVRDYIHVMDLAAGHRAAIQALGRIDASEAVNLGTGRGYSVLEMIKAAEAASGNPIPHKVVGRREGDLARVFADVTKSAELLDWRAVHTVEEMCRDHWNWQSANPNGYEIVD